MTKINPIAIATNEEFMVGESDFDFFYDHPHRNVSGAILVCVKGHANATINLHSSLVTTDTIMLLIPGSILMLADASDDFKIAFFAFSDNLFAEASFRLEPSFFHFLIENPVCVRSEKSSQGVHSWLKATSYVYMDRENIFRKTIMKNRLQNILLEMYDKIKHNMSNQLDEGTGRQKELFHKFISLVNANCLTQRQVSFYADKLCITTRYLSTIVRNVTHISPKDVIDRQIMLEIKLLLHSTDLSIQEIAYKLHFSDQSYFGRYFKKHMHKSPTDYRNEK
ncbi:MAG: helix-turn-helix domain-containing protein [Alistipes sp.]